jgi:hypothetical protein
MSDEPMREVTVQATLNDVYDGLIRLLGDIQRFGFGLSALTLATATGSPAVATIIISAPTRIDTRLIAARLARHPAVISADVAGMWQEPDLVRVAVAA